VELEILGAFKVRLPDDGLFNLVKNSAFKGILEMKNKKT